MSWCLKILTEWPPVGKIVAHSTYDMFSWYKYLIFNLVFSHLGFWSGNLFLIVPFPDLCLLVPFNAILLYIHITGFLCFSKWRFQCYT